VKKLFLALLLAIVALTAVSVAVTGCGDETGTTSTNADVQKQLDDLKSAIPKFAIPMREVGDRFDNIFFAAKGGNWALAAYMSKYMNNAMNPAKVTKPDEYPAWSSFYTGAFDPVNKAIAAKDFDAFDKAYTAVINSCNACHDSMGYKFIKISKAEAPVNIHMDYNMASEPTDVPK
jgi:hypothetical protein